jgi:hypothetical protein
MRFLSFRCVQYREENMEVKKNKKSEHTFPVKPKFRGRSSVDCSIKFICEGAGVHVVARVPSAGPVPPPTSVVMPTYILKLWNEISIICTPRMFISVFII